MVRGGWERSQGSFALLCLRQDRAEAPVVSYRVSLRVGGPVFWAIGSGGGV